MILIFMGFIILLCASVILASRHFAILLRYNPVKPGHIIYEREVVGGKINLKLYNSLPKQMLHIPSKFGYQIACTLITPHLKTNRFIILSHGVSVSQLNSVKYMELFVERGYNVLLYDQRRHGFTGGKTTTYGYYEKWDLKSVVDWMYDTFGEDILLGIHGESMGAATTLLYAGEIEDRCDFFIADCAYSDLETLLKHQMTFRYGLPPFPFVQLAHFFWKKHNGFGFDQVSPIKHVHQIRKPVLFIHSKEDKYTPAFHTEQLHKSMGENSTLLVCPDGGHACSLNENRDYYEETLDQFLHAIQDVDFKK